MNEHVRIFHTEADVDLQGSVDSRRLGAPDCVHQDFQTMLMQYSLCGEKMFDYVHQELAVSIREHEIIQRKKIAINLQGLGLPWKMGPVDLVTPVSMAV